METFYEKKQHRFGVGDTVYLNISGEWKEGNITEEGDESVLIQWEHIFEPVEHQRSDMGNIKLNKIN